MMATAERDTQRVRRSPVSVPRVSLLSVLVLLTAACAQPGSEPGNAAPDPASAGTGVTPADYTGRFRVVGTVLEDTGVEDGMHGPQLCAAVFQSLPPQCGGPDILGWDWTGLGAESVGGTTWGDYVLTGTWDGTALTLTEPPRTGTDADRPTSPDTDFGSPCAEPAGGWAAPDPDRASDERIEQGVAAAAAVPGYGGLWVDNAPRVTVVNVTTTGDLAAMETAVRRVWGGALCVSRTAHDEATLLAAQRDITGRDGVLGSGTDVLTGRLQVQVLVATGALQSELDVEFGAGLVELQPFLIPID